MTTAALRLVEFPPIFTVSDRSATRLFGVQEFTEHAGETASASVSLDDLRSETSQALLEAALDASLANWDGLGARAVTTETVAQALSLLESLPSTVDAPDISVHPDGELSFYWTRGRRATLVVSVSGSGRVSFASILGQRRFHGTEYLVNGLPTSLELVLRQLHANEE